MTFCVLVACSDSRKDIFDICFRHSDLIWKNCYWPRYVGLTTPRGELYGFKVVTSPKQEWREAVTGYINALPNEIGYVLLMVEDALFMKPVDTEQLNEVAALMAKKDMDYIRLVPLRRNWYDKFRRRIAIVKPPIISINKQQYLDFIPAREPYYSSSEMTLWKRSYLLELLAIPVNVWEFEFLAFEHKIHWATSKAIFDQHQIVQKGRWNRQAPKLLNRAVGGGTRQWKKFLKHTNRPFQTRKAQLRGWRENLSFALFGFASLRIKRWLKSQ